MWLQRLEREVKVAIWWLTEGECGGSRRLGRARFVGSHFRGCHNGVGKIETKTSITLTYYKLQ